MRLESILFGGKESYQRMADVLSYTAQLNCSVPLSIRRVDVTQDEIKKYKAKEHAINNALKTKLHCEIVNRAKDGELIGLLDSDLMVLHDLADIEPHMKDMDFAYTVRPDKWPFNTGVTFVKVSEKTRKWYQKWYFNSIDFIKHPSKLKKAEQRWGGINQCSLGLMLESDHDLNILQLPCYQWNCVPNTYIKFDADQTKIVHILGKLRGMCVCGERGGTQYAQSLWRMWNSFEHQLKTIRDKEPNKTNGSPYRK